jgi:cytochrome c heme-lyase
MGNKVSREGPPPAAIPNTSSPPQESECPVPERYRNQAVYNVYNQRINDPSSNAAASAGKVVVEGLDILDPKNNMPLEPNQQPCPGQKKLISTDRVVSNIPKGGTEATWVYPSPQMFYNGTFFFFFSFNFLPSTRLLKFSLSSTCSFKTKR